MCPFAGLSEVWHTFSQTVYRSDGATCWNSFLPSPMAQFQQDPSGRWRFLTRLCLLSPSEGIPPARWWAAFQRGCWNWLFQSSSARPHWINCYFWKEENREREELLLLLKKANEVNHISYWKMQLFICRYNTRPIPIDNFFRAYKLELFKMGQLWVLCGGKKSRIRYLMKAKNILIPLPVSYDFANMIQPYCKMDLTLINQN